MLLAPEGRDGQHPADFGRDHLADLLLEPGEGLLADEPQRVLDDGHEGHFPSVHRLGGGVHVQQVHLVVLEQQGCLSVLDQLRVFLQGVAPELQELLVVVEQDRRGGLLVVAVIARVEHLDPDLALLVEVSGRDGVARRASPEVYRNNMRVGTVLLQ